jgi:predicted phage terminase large subunit-like protein
MTIYDHRNMEALARDRLLPFLLLCFEHLHPGEPPLKPVWYLRAMCWWLEKVARGERRFSMIWLMPRALKSVTVAVAFPLWLLGWDPTAKIMVATYGEKLSGDHADLRRSIIESGWYRRMFPGTRLDPRGNRKLELITTKGGYCKAVSVGGAVTGRGADIIIIDDCMKSDEQDSQAVRDGVKNWFDRALSTRLNDKRTGSIISISQRLHEDDLPAHLLGKGYEVLSLPAVAERDEVIEIGPGEFHHRRRGDLLDPERFPQAVLDQELINLGPQNHSAQYQQQPVAPGGNLIRQEKLRTYYGTIPRHRFDRIIQSWDTAATALPTSDWSACTTWGYVAGRLFLLDIYRARIEYPVLKAMIVAKRSQWQAHHVIIETENNGLAVAQQLAAERSFRPVAWPPRGTRQKGKAERLIAQSGQIEEGRIWLPSQMDGLDIFLSELRAFPNGRHDDQVDTLTQLLEFTYWRWKKLHEERDESGRLFDRVRGSRPPLPPLPDWIDIDED